MAKYSAFSACNYCKDNVQFITDGQIHVLQSAESFADAAWENYTANADAAGDEYVCSEEEFKSGAKWAYETSDRIQSLKS